MSPRAEFPARPAHDCPLCGGPNGCVPARCGHFDAPCWCRAASFSADLLARVPVAQRGLVCICAGCAAGHAAGGGAVILAKVNS